MLTTIYWFEAPSPGRMGIMPRPRGGEWLGDEIAGWKAAGVDTLVSLLMHEEIEELGLAEEASQCAASGIEFLSLGIKDRDVPILSGAFMDLVRKVAQRSKEGKTIAIHCRMGIGRSSLVASCAMIMRGVTAEESIKRITAARGRPVPDTQDQRNMLDDFEGKYFEAAR